MRRSTVIFVAVALALCRATEYDEDGNPVVVTCEMRCERIHERSLDRIGYSIEGADRLIGKGKAHEKLRDICWKQYDYFYCMKGCAKSMTHEKYVRHVKNKCRSVIEDLEPGLSCLYKYRSFLEIRCSSFMNEAVKLKEADDPTLLPDKETCRYLHLNALCLENSVTNFCPQASSFFRRINLRDYFLNHFLPANDQLFDDQDLDACQIKNFVKEAAESESEEDLTTLLTTLDTKTTPTEKSVKSTTVKSSSSASSGKPTPSRPPIIRTLSPSVQLPYVQTSTTANFVYTTPRKQPSPTVVGGKDDILVTKEDIERMNRYSNHPSKTMGKITVKPRKPVSKTTTTNTTPEPESAGPTEAKVSTSTTRRRIFESDEDFAQTPPNFYWGTFRGEAYKIARNYSESFPHDTEFVTPVNLESNTLFGEDDDTYDDNFAKHGDHSIDRDEQLTVVTGRPLSDNDEETQAVKPTAAIEEDKEDDSDEIPIYSHGVDSHLEPTKNVVSLLSSEETTMGRVLPTDSLSSREEIVNEDDNAIGDNEFEGPENELNPTNETKNDDVVEKESKENNFEEALTKDASSDDDDSYIFKHDVVEEIEISTSTSTTPQTFTPLINGGRVAVKPIKKFSPGMDTATISDDSAQDWTGDTTDTGEYDYDKETYVTSEVLDDDDEASNVRRRLNFVLLYTALFFFLFLIVVCCILCVIARNQRRANAAGSGYKLQDSV